MEQEIIPSFARQLDEEYHQKQSTNNTTNTNRKRKRDNISQNEYSQSQDSTTSSIQHDTSSQYSSEGIFQDDQHHSSSLVSNKRQHLEIGTQFISSTTKTTEWEEGPLDLEDESNIEELERFVISMHRNGINIRYLGLVRHHVTTEHLRKMLMTEMIARTMKQLLRKLLRQFTSPKKDNEELLNSVATFLNTVFGNSTNSNFKFQNSNEHQNEY